MVNLRTLLVWVWALLGCTGLTQALTYPPPMQLPPTYPPSPASPDSEVCQNPFFQFLSLCFFYFTFNGKHWSNNTGWENCWDILIKPNSTVTSGSCLLSTGSLPTRSQPMWGAATPQPLEGNTSLAVFPDACCWHGVTCCRWEHCINELDNPLTCNCIPGLVVGLSLVHNNMTGDINGSSEGIPIYDALGWLACSLRGLQFQNNGLNGSLPSDITMLSELWVLGLGYNHITGTIPLQIGHMTSLHVLELTSNRLSGTVPVDMCGDPALPVVSALTDILLANNKLTGIINITKCIDAIVVDVSNNLLSGITADLPFYPQLHAVQMQNNLLQSGNMDIDLSRARVMTELNLGSNSLNGTVPASLSSQFYITSLILEHNYYTGNLSTDFFDNLGALSNLDLSNNQLTGSLPKGLGRASSLNRLDLSVNFLTGVLPDSLVNSIVINNSFLDIRSTFMSCCGSNFTLHPNGTGRYAAMDYSLPRLPEGLTFSTVLQPLSNQSNPLLLNSGSNLNCPFLKPAVLPAPNRPGSLAQNQTGLLVTWFLDPAYTLYEQCKCDPGSVLVNDTKLFIAYCVLAPAEDSQADLTWVWILVAVLGAALLLALVLWLMFFRGTRPIIVQNFLDMRKRLKGAPQGGLVSIVVTDIQGFSDLMKEFPELTTTALLIHNNIIRKALWTNFGTTIEQEGDSFSVVFHEAQDAVRFCLQTQLLLAQQSWPPGLFDCKESTDPSLRKREGSSLKQRRSNLLKRLHLVPRTSRSQSQLGRPSRPSFPRLNTSAEPLEIPSRIQGQVPVQRSRNVGAAAVPAAASPVKGLRVRMGIATGDVPPNSVLASSHVMELAKSVSDAGAGGQVLMCSSTFQAVRTMGRELGCVDVNGLNYSKLNSNKAKWVLFWRRKQQQEQAVLLHMGSYMYCKPGTTPPVVLMPQHLQFNVRAESKRWKPYGIASAAPEQQVTATAGSVSSTRSVRLYQVLAPSLVARGRFFGSKLSLKEEWMALDVPYFSAPGALLAPLTPSDFVPSHLGLPLVTMVFCMVDGGKQYASRSRRDAQAVHAQLVALMKSVLRQVPGGYSVKGQQGDLKYMVAFADSTAALSWCLAVQECAMYVDWPASALRQWPEERNAANQLLFRGPRLKMGVCEGAPRSILPDYNGRADYLGDSVNQAARFMESAAHGGQVACKEDLAMRFLSSAPSSFTGPAAAAEPPSPNDRPSWPSGPDPVGAGAPASDTKQQLPGRSSQSMSTSPALGSFATRQLATYHEDGGSEAVAANGGPTGGSHAEPCAPQKQQQQVQQTHVPAAAPAAPLPAKGSLPGLVAPEPSPSVTIEVKSTPRPNDQLALLCQSEVVAVHLGSFRFKGMDEVVSMARITQASLAGRRFPSGPSQGRGRVGEAKGILSTAHAPLLDIINEYTRRGSLLDRPSAAPLPWVPPAARMSSRVRVSAGSPKDSKGVAAVVKPCVEE